MYIQDDPYASYKLLKREFEEFAYTVTEEMIDGQRFVTYTSPSGKVWRTRAAHLSYPQVADAKRRLILHKNLAYAFASKHGMPIPYTKHLGDDQALGESDMTQLLSQHKTLIVKPATASLSRGLTLNITTPHQLQAAIKKASKISRSILVQEQVDGEEIRFVVLDGKVVSALLRRTPYVVGDGILTLAELIQEENQRRIALKFDMISYPQLDETIIDSSLLTSNSIPRQDEVVELNRATMIKNGCSVYDVLSTIHPSYVSAVEALVKKLDVGFVVVDVFVKDFTKAKTKQNHWFIEFNSAPVLKLFYGCRDGNMFDIVPSLVESIDRFLHRNTSTKEVIFGGFEPVCFPDFMDETITAKIDTGAYSGALYATNIREKTDETGLKYLSFALLGDKKQSGVSYDFYTRTVRSAHGHAQSRYVIRAKLKIKGKLYETDIGLSDRADLKYPVLIGRKFLRDHRIIVDVIVNEELDLEKELLG